MITFTMADPGFAKRGSLKLKFCQRFEMAMFVPLVKPHVCREVGYPSGEIPCIV